MHLSNGCPTGTARRMIALAAALLLLPLTVLAPALAKDNDDDDGNRGRNRDYVGERSYEYDDRGCRYKYKEDEDGYKVEYRCRDGSFGAEDYEYKVEYDGCKYEYEQDARGYKERLECKDGEPWWIAGRGLALRHGGLPSEVRGGPFGIGGGTCDIESIGQAAGGAIGDVIGSRMGEGSGRDIAAIAGAVIGVIIDSETGRSVDQDCVGQALEHGRAGRPVEWRDPDSGARVRVTPTDDFTDRDGRYCREFRSLIEGLAGRDARETIERACRREDGGWERVG